MVRAWLLAVVIAAVILASHGLSMFLVILACLTAAFGFLLYRARNLSIDLDNDRLVIHRLVSRDTIRRAEIASVVTDNTRRGIGLLYSPIVGALVALIVGGGFRPWERLSLRLNIGLQVLVLSKPVDRGVARTVDELSPSVVYLAQELRQWLNPAPDARPG